MSVESLIDAAASLRDDADEIALEMIEEGSAECIYNPLRYAWEVHVEYLRIAGGLGAKTILMGMNPGPHGMGQMGIPFAATTVVRDILGISGIEVQQPTDPHPSRPVNGLSHPKEEVSGSRLWGNHCPLLIFSGPRATNVTPDKIRGKSVTSLIERCDEHLREVVGLLGPDSVVGVGKYAERRARESLASSDVLVTSCWHPSPASPLANRNGGEDWRQNFSSVLP